MKTLVIAAALAASVGLYGLACAVIADAGAGGIVSDLSLVVICLGFGLAEGLLAGAVYRFVAKRR